MVPVMEAMEVGASSGDVQRFPLQVLDEQLMTTGGGAASGGIWGWWVASTGVGGKLGLVGGRHQSRRQVAGSSR